jgi:hypothetical protein
VLITKLSTVFAVYDDEAFSGILRYMAKLSKCSKAGKLDLQVCGKLLQSLAPRKLQESVECPGSDRMRLNPWQVLSGQVTQSVPGRNFEE